MSNSPCTIDMMPTLMTVAAAAKYLGCHEETVRRAIRDKRLECYRPQRRCMISIEQLKKFLDSSQCRARQTEHHGSNGAEEVVRPPRIDPPLM